MPRKDLPPLKYDVPPGFTPEKFQAQWDVIVQLSTQKAMLERQLFLLNNDIERAWKALPVSIKPRAWIECRKCGDKTQDRFGGTAMCSKHIAHGDEALAKILEDVLYGPDE